ncbi:hypothetical protein K439DRAFT_1633284 [Ramaria rubella]|nr:hypothetical protein K439DRAFT_1633284 [Ramaria rubella]
MKRARVPHADPPRFSQVDPTGLKDLLERTMGAALTSEAVLPGEHRCEANWTFGSALGEVEVAVNVFDSHKAAVQSMRAALSYIFAPLKDVFVSTLALGQLTLEGVGGYGIIFFVRDNVFIKMKGLPSSEKLGDIAGPIDAFLKEKEKDRNQVPAPPMEPGDLPPRQVQEKAGCMAASTDMAIVQLLEVDKANATFKLFAVAAGKADIHMVFAHESTLQTTTKKWKLKWLEMQMRNCK